MDRDEKRRELLKQTKNKSVPEHKKLTKGDKCGFVKPKLNIELRGTSEYISHASELTAFRLKKLLRDLEEPKREIERLWFRNNEDKLEPDIAIGAMLKFFDSWQVDKLVFKDCPIVNNLLLKEKYDAFRKENERTKAKNGKAKGAETIIASMRKADIERIKRDATMFKDIVIMMPYGNLLYDKVKSALQEKVELTESLEARNETNSSTVSTEPLSFHVEVSGIEFYIQSLFEIKTEIQSESIRERIYKSSQGQVIKVKPTLTMFDTLAVSNAANEKRFAFVEFVEGLDQEGRPLTSMGYLPTSLIKKLTG